MKSPCLNCEKRRVLDDFNCHSVCNEYLVYQEKMIAVRDEKHAQNANKRHYRSR